MLFRSQAVAIVDWDRLGDCDDWRYLWSVRGDRMDREARRPIDGLEIQFRSRPLYYCDWDLIFPSVGSSVVDYLRSP